MDAVYLMLLLSVLLVAGCTLADLDFAEHSGYVSPHDTAGSGSCHHKHSHYHCHSYWDTVLQQYLL